MSTNLQIGSIDYGNLIAGDGPLVTQSDTLAAGAEHVAGEVLGRIKLATGTPVVDENTGDGAVTGFALGNGAKVGNYTLECLSAAPEMALEAITDGGTNTGDGTIATESVTVGSTAQDGDYVLECIDVDETFEAAVTLGGSNAGDGTIAAENLTVGETAQVGDYTLTCVSAASSLAAGTPVSSATSVMGSITLGSKAQEGDYICTCLTADGSPTWQVRSPAGGILPTATSGVPYSNPQLGFTITNPASTGDTITLPVTRSYTGGGVFSVVDPSGDRLADAAVPTPYEGGGLTLTITGGASSFEPGDTITVTVSATRSGGTFSVTDPTGDQLAPATVGVEYVGGGLTLTVAEGATTPFVIGDTITVSVSTTTEGSGAWSVVDPDGLRFADATVNVAYTGPVKFTVDEGDTPFTPGNTFTLPVAAGSGYLKVCDKASRDGSQNPIGVLAAAVDATEADTDCVIYRSGKFNSTKLVCATGTTYEDLKDALAELCIYARASL